MSPPSNAASPARESYPRQRARTRGFQLGRPRSFHIADERVLFIRSASSDDSAGSLWSIELKDGGLERCIVDVRKDIPFEDDGNLPEAERARRERMREVTAGITAYSVDSAGNFAVFAAQGTPYAVELATGAVTALPAPGPVVDPRIHPGGNEIAFVVERSLYVVQRTDPDTGAVCVAQAESEHESWGLADFIAAEELGRFRGHWWIPGPVPMLLVEQFDDSAVPIWWIADPAQPTSEPTTHRYPAAGTVNANVALWCIDMQGRRTAVTWDRTEYPYVASVSVDEAGVVIELLTRSQTTSQACNLDATTGQLTEIQTRSDAAWVDVMPGVPCLDASGALLEIVADHEVDSYRLLRGGQAITPALLQVRALLAHDDTSAVVTASAEPTTQALYRVSYADGSVTALTDEGQWTSGVCEADILVTGTADAFMPQTIFSVRHGDLSLEIANHAAVPNVDVRPTYLTAGTLRLESCVLWPTGHRPGTGPLPVILSPYGGPHAQRVMRNAAAFTTEQWMADQGFAVIVIDGRGTPGRGPSWERAVHRDLASYPVADQADALQALAAELPDLDLGRVGIRGWSFGGYLAALAVLDRPDVFHAAVAGAPVTEWRLYDTAYTERYLGHPDEDPEAYDRSSLLPRAVQLTRPLLLIHGLADDNVHVAHTMQLSSALLAAGRAHAVVPLSGVTHMTPQEIVAENLLRLEIDFFREHLGGPE